MKVSRPLAELLHREIAIVVGLNELGQTDRANKILMKLAETVAGQTVVVVDDCEKCCFRQKYVGKQ